MSYKQLLRQLRTERNFRLFTKGEKCPVLSAKIKELKKLIKKTGRREE